MNTKCNCDSRWNRKLYRVVANKSLLKRLHRDIIHRNMHIHSPLVHNNIWLWYLASENKLAVVYFVQLFQAFELIIVWFVVCVFFSFRSIVCLSFLCHFYSWNTCIQFIYCILTHFSRPRSCLHQSSIDETLNCQVHCLPLQDVYQFYSS